MILCDECGEKAELCIERSLRIENIETEVVIIHPRDSYEQNLMTDYLCNKCAKESGYIE